MRLTEGIREAFDTVRHNKVRTALTILSIVIGVASVIAVMALGIMGRRALMGDLAALGGALYWIEPEAGEWDDERRDQYLRIEHLDAIAALVADTSWVSPILRGAAELRFRDREASARLFGVGTEYPELWPTPVQAGRFLDAQDRLQRRKVIVLGDRVAHRLFDDPGRAVGSVVSAGSLQLQVVGVMAARDSRSAGDGSDERTCYLPHELYRTIYPWDSAVGPHVPAITLRARDSAQLGAAIARLQRFLDRVLPGSPSVRPFVVATDQARIEMEAQVLRVVTTVVTLVAGISLLVGGLGIMNIMLVSVSERTTEIGLRKAVGARDGDILGQFLIESVVICLLGGGCGVLLGFGGTLAVALALGWDLFLPGVGAVGLGVAVATGLFFGVYPAAKAARLPPVVALSRD